MKSNVDGLCFGCMRVLEKDGHCPYCDFNLEEYEMSPHCMRPGERINRYVIGRVIGEGNFGITYIGRDTLLERVVAIKEYFPRHYVSRDVEGHSGNEVYVYHKKLDDRYQKELEKFCDEAKKLSRFSDISGIVSVMDFFHANGTAYLVMSYVEGITLKEHVKKYGAMSGDVVLELMKPMIEALMSVHKEGIIHRDISPDNIIVNRQGKLVLIDFGAARQESSALTHSMTVLFKRGYTPEEQYRGRGRQGTWSDVYSLCATMYFMLTGISPSEAIDRMLEDTLVSLCDMPEVALTASEKQGIMQGLAVKAEQRIQDMSVLLEQLYNQEGEPVSEGNQPEKPISMKNSHSRGRSGIFNVVKGRNQWKIGVAVLILCAVFAVWNKSSPKTAQSGRTEKSISRGDGAGRAEKSISHGDGAGRAEATPIVSPTPQKKIYAMVNLTGMSKKEAEARIGGLGDDHLKVRWKWKYSSSVAKGKIIKQSIGEGTEYEEGTEQTQTLTVSRGVRKYTVPDVVGLDSGDAVKRLKKKKFLVRTVYSESSRPKGTVLKQGRKAGKKAEKGTEITLTVSDGSGYGKPKETSPAKRPPVKKQPSGDDFVAKIPE